MTTVVMVYNMDLGIGKNLFEEDDQQFKKRINQYMRCVEKAP